MTTARVMSRLARSLRPAFTQPRRRRLGNVRSALLVSLFALSAACQNSVTTPFPDDAVTLVPPVPYARWWALTEQCSGHSGDFASVQWFVVHRPTIDIGDEASDGSWYRDGNRIVVAQPYVLDGGLVRHEMLHALLQDGSHPLDQFTARCGGIVDYGDALHRAPAFGQIAPDASSPVIDGSTLLISGQVTPDPVSIGLPDSAWVSAAVSVTNPLGVAVWVRIARIDSLNPYGRTFGFEIIRPDSVIDLRGATFFADSLMPFGPHETKTQVFDRQISRQLGTWRLGTSFNSDTYVTRSFVMTP